MEWGWPRTGLTFVICTSPQDFICFLGNGPHHPPPQDAECHLVAVVSGVSAVLWAGARIPADEWGTLGQRGRQPNGLLGPKSPALSGSHLPAQGVESPKQAGPQRVPSHKLLPPKGKSREPALG